jgi:hypothetical protein
MVMHRIAAGTPDATGWYAAHSTFGKFTVLLPAPFNDFTVRGTSDKTGTLTTAHAVGTQLANGVKLAATCIWGGQAPTDSLDTLSKLDGMTANRELVVDNHPTIEVEAGTTAVMQAIAYTDHVCLLSVEAQHPPATVPVTDARKMFASFRRDP